MWRTRNEDSGLRGGGGRVGLDDLMFDKREEEKGKRGRVGRMAKKEKSSREEGGKPGRPISIYTSTWCARIP